MELPDYEPATIPITELDNFLSHHPLPLRTFSATDAESRDIIDSIKLHGFRPTLCHVSVAYIRDICKYIMIDGDHIMNILRNAEIHLPGVEGLPSHIKVSVYSFDRIIDEGDTDNVSSLAWELYNRHTMSRRLSNSAIMRFILKSEMKYCGRQTNVTLCKTLNKIITNFRRTDKRGTVQDLYRYEKSVVRSFRAPGSNEFRPVYDKFGLYAIESLCKMLEKHVEMKWTTVRETFKGTNTPFDWTQRYYMVLELEQLVSSTYLRRAIRDVNNWQVEHQAEGNDPNYREKLRTAINQKLNFPAAPPTHTPNEAAPSPPPSPSPSPSKKRIRSNSKGSLDAAAANLEALKKQRVDSPEIGRNNASEQPAPHDTSTTTNSELDFEPGGFDGAPDDGVVTPMPSDSDTEKPSFVVEHSPVNIETKEVELTSKQIRDNNRYLDRTPGGQQKRKEIAETILTYCPVAAFGIVEITFLAPCSCQLTCFRSTYPINETRTEVNVYQLSKMLPNLLHRPRGESLYFSEDKQESYVCIYNGAKRNRYKKKTTGSYTLFDDETFENRIFEDDYDENVKFSQHFYDGAEECEF